MMGRYTHISVDMISQEAKLNRKGSKGTKAGLNYYAVNKELFNYSAFIRNRIFKCVTPSSHIFEHTYRRLRRGMPSNPCVHHTRSRTKTRDGL